MRKRRHNFGLRRLRGFFFLLVIGSVLICQGEAAALQDETFTLAEAAEYTIIDPQKAGGGSGSFFTNVYQSLISPSGLDAHILAEVAESWELLDPSSWKLNLRKNMTFHNGDPVTSADVKYSVDRQLGRTNPKFRSSNVGVWRSVIDKVETPDKHTAIIKSRKPNASFLAYMRFIWILPKNYIEKVGDDEFGRKPIGTGPFMITDRKIGESLTMEAYEGYWNTSPEPGARGASRIKRVILRAIPQEQTRIAALKTNEIQASLVGADTARALEKDANISMYYTYKNAPAFVMYNWGPTRKERKTKDFTVYDKTPNPLKDVRVRRALIQAVDLDALIKNYGTGKEYRTTMVGRGGIGYSPDVPFYEHDPEKAKKLLAEAGYANGFKTKFYVGQDIQPYVEAMLQYWRDIGISIELVHKTTPVVRRLIYKKELDGMVLWGAGFGGFDPAATWLRTCVKFNGTWAIHGKDDKVDELVEKQSIEFDVKKRSALIDEIIQIIWKDAWFVPLWERVYIQAVRAEWDYDKMPFWATFYFSGVAKKQ